MPISRSGRWSSIFFFNDTATTEIYTLSLHDALPISDLEDVEAHAVVKNVVSHLGLAAEVGNEDRKSTRLNSSHSQISYAVFCLKKKKKKNYYAITDTVKVSPHST